MNWFRRLLHRFRGPHCIECDAALAFCERPACPHCAPKRLDMLCERCHWARQRRIVLAAMAAAAERTP